MQPKFKRILYGAITTQSVAGGDLERRYENLKDARINSATINVFHGQDPAIRERIQFRNWTKS